MYLSRDKKCFFTFSFLQHFLQLCSHFLKKKKLEWFENLNVRKNVDQKLVEYTFLVQL